MRDNYNPSQPTVPRPQVVTQFPCITFRPRYCWTHYVATSHKVTLGLGNGPTPTKFVVCIYSTSNKH